MYCHPCSCLPCVRARTQQVRDEGDHALLVRCAGRRGAFGAAADWLLQHGPGPRLPQPPEPPLQPLLVRVHRGAGGLSLQREPRPDRAV